MFYRSLIQNCKLVHYEIKLNESNLLIYSNERFYQKAKSYLKEARRVVEHYIKSNLNFAESFKPLKLDRRAPFLIKSMLKAAQIANVGPMASVAGAIAEFVGKKLLIYTPEVIIENGGDIFLKTSKERTIAIFAGKSQLSKKIAIVLPKSTKPYGICTSSGTVGHSFSHGKADAVVIVSRNCAYSDAWATRVANMIKNESDTQKAISFIKKERHIQAGLIIMGKKLAVTGNITLKII